MSVYTLSKLVKTFGQRTVLDIDSLFIEEGLIYSLLGPNGAGKTTLLNILGFLDQPTTGNITFKNKPVFHSKGGLHKLRRHVVMVNQDPILFTTTVFKNMEIGLKIRGINRKKRKQIVEESLDLVGMRHLSNAPAHKLSGGETKRVVLARALALSPEVILCDEPTANVDPENQAIITDLLQAINAEKNITLIFTSHDKIQTADLTQHMLYLENGHINDLSYENVFTAMFLPLDNQTSRCIVQDKLELILPESRQGKARVRIDPKNITVHPEPSKGGFQNNFTGLIKQISKENDLIQLKVHGCISIIAQMTETEYRTHRLMVGDTVHMTILPEAVFIL